MPLRRRGEGSVLDPVYSAPRSRCLPRKRIALPLRSEPFVADLRSESIPIGWVVHRLIRTGADARNTGHFTTCGDDRAGHQTNAAYLSGTPAKRSSRFQSESFRAADLRSTAESCSRPIRYGVRRRSGGRPRSVRGPAWRFGAWLAHRARRSLRQCMA